MSKRHNQLMPNSHHSSNSVEHFTPLDIVEAARSLMGGIDLDPATTERANKERIHAKRFYTKETNGLVHKWKGRVFLNPPGGRIDENGKPVKHGGRSSAKVWWRKLVEEYQANRVTEAVFIGFTMELLQTTQIPSRNTLTRSITEDRIIEGRSMTDFPICIPKRRISFDMLKGKKWVTGDQPTHANVIVYLPPVKLNPRDGDWMAGALNIFAPWFGDIGAIMAPFELS